MPPCLIRAIDAIDVYVARARRCYRAVDIIDITLRLSPGAARVVDMVTLFTLIRFAIAAADIVIDAYMPLLRAAFVIFTHACHAATP